MTDPVIVKQDGLFLLCMDDGDIHPASDQGLYFHDMRHISAETLRVDTGKLISILADASEGHEAHFELTNSARLAVRRKKCLGTDYTQYVAIENYTATDAELTL